MGDVAVAQESPVGSELAGYRITGVLGRGATSIVYRALELRLEREVALKLLSPELSEDRSFRKRFERESKAAASLQHPNIVPVHAAGEVEGKLFIAMRLIEGSDLKALLHKEERLRAERALATCAQLASALDAAHASGLLHRDVKPSNVLIEQDADGDEHVYLADFGLAKTAASGTRMTESGRLLGTIDYMAPEQIRGQDVDGRADLYSLGCLLYECLVGEPPFARRSDVATIYAHLHEPPPAASDRKPVLPQAIDAVLARALAKQPEERYPTGTELVEEARVALGLPVETSQRPWRRRRKLRPALLATAVVVAAVAVGSALALRGAGSGGDGSSGAPAHTRVTPLPDYRVTATARIFNGALGAEPVVGLIAVADNGKGPPARKISPRATGELAFRFDARRLTVAGEVGDSFLVNLAPGTRIGYYQFWGAGGQYPVVVTGKSTDAKTASQVARADIRWSRDVWPLFGRVMPVTIRQRDTELVATLDFQGTLQRYRAAKGITPIVLWHGLYLRGVFVNPLEPTDVHASVAARPCVDANCTRLGATASDEIVYRLPNDITVRAPPRAVYGKHTTFTGTGVRGENVHIARYVKPGPGRKCTEASNDFCVPRFGPLWSTDPEVATRVRDDGTWSLRVTMHPQLVQPGVSLTGRWAGVASSDEPLVGSLFDTSVFAEASADTIVALAKPELRLRRRGSRLEVHIAVDGGDSLVRYALRFEGKQVDAGHLPDDGTIISVVPAPDHSGRFDVTVSVRGVEPATSSVVFRP
jgi:serine/threonine-protein kinase